MIQFKRISVQIYFIYFFQYIPPISYNTRKGMNADYFLAFFMYNLISYSGNTLRFQFGFPSCVGWGMNEANESEE